MQKLTVDAQAAGSRLDVYLAARLQMSREQVKELIKDGLVTVNDQQAKASQRLGDADKVHWRLRDPQPRPAPPELPIVYEDDELLVIDKPAGIVVHPGSGTSEGTIADFAAGRVEDNDPIRPGIVHRLDKDTSGLLVIAKKPKAKAWLQKLFSQGEVGKTYLALVQGHLAAPEALIRLPLDRSGSRPTARTVKIGGKLAETHYKVLMEYPDQSLIEVHPKTGRTHQIRAHFAHLGHPVAGDTVYGDKKRPPGLSRQFLHASRIVFAMPGGKQVDLSSPLPVDLQQFLDRLPDKV